MRPKCLGLCLPKTVLQICKFCHVDCWVRCSIPHPTWRSIPSNPIHPLLAAMVLQPSEMEFFSSSLFFCLFVFCEHTVSVHCCTCPRTVEKLPKMKRSLKTCIVTTFQKRPRFRSEPQIRLDEMAGLQFLVVGCSSQNAVLRLPRILLHCAAPPNLYAITQGRSAGVKGAATGSDGLKVALRALLFPQNGS